MSEFSVQRALAAIAEPTRFRIVGLLAERACTVGEVQEAIGALQPQTSKHLQALEAAGLIRVRKLGRRRVASLDRGTMQALGAFFADLAAPRGEDGQLDAYEQAVRREEERTDDGARTLRFARTLAATANEVWSAWTDPEIAARWWTPSFFEVDEFRIAPDAGAPIRFALREGGGARYVSAGSVLEASAPNRLVFALAPLDDGGEPLFAARHTLALTDVGADAESDAGRTELTFEIEVSAVSEEAASAVAGLEPGWTHLLDSLAELLSARR